MNSNHVPVNAYIFIGLASVVMAVVTLMDSNGPDNKQVVTSTETSSVTDMLPTITNPFSSNPAEAVIEEPKQQGNMFETNNDVAGQNVGQPENNNMFNAFGNNDNNAGIFGKNENSEDGLVNEMPNDMPPLENPFEQPVGQQPGIFGGKKYNKTNKHTSKRNKKTKNHRKK